MDFDFVSQDTSQPSRSMFFARIEPVCLPSGGHLLNGTALIAEGPGPHPAIILLHGFPGYETNFDLGHIYRRAGWNVLIFHYRGSWGSAGRYSFKNVLEDVSAAVDFLCEPNTCARYQTDPSTLVLIGHSLGGFAALMTAANDSRIKSVISLAGFNLGACAKSITDEVEVARITQSFENNLRPLFGATGRGLVEELLRHGEAWNLLCHTGELARQSVLLIGATRDEIAPAEIHHYPLVGKISCERENRLQHIVMDTDHVFSDKRVALARTTLAWLTGRFGLRNGRCTSDG